MQLQYWLTTTTTPGWSLQAHLPSNVAHQKIDLPSKDRLTNTIYSAIFLSYLYCRLCHLPGISQPGRRCQGLHLLAHVVDTVLAGPTSPLLPFPPTTRVHHLVPFSPGYSSFNGLTFSLVDCPSLFTISQHDNVCVSPAQVLKNIFNHDFYDYN